MRHTAPLSLRTAGAAIAAVLALPTTAAIAQDATAPVAAPTAPAPVIVLPQPAPPPPAPAPVLVVPAQPSAPAAAAEAAEPVATATAERVRPAATRAAPRAAAPARPAPVTAAPVVVPPAIEAAPVETLPGDIEFAPTQAAEPSEVTVAPTGVSDGDGLSAGELGLIGGALAIGGIAAAALLSRRRRSDPAPEPIDVFAASRAAPPPPREPVVTPVATRVAPTPAQPARQPAPAMAATASGGAIPIGRRTPGNVSVGRHEAMIDAGPTADNPFLTRKNRLRRARFLDKQEAMMLAQDQPTGDWMDDYRRQYRTASGR